MTRPELRGHFRFRRPRATMAIVALGLPLALAFADPSRTLAGLQLATFFTLFVPLGTASVVAIGLLTRAKWMVEIYGPARLLISLMPLAASFALPVVVLSIWVEGGGSYPDGSFASFWMHPGMLAGRSAAFLLLWTLLLERILRSLPATPVNSPRQGESSPRAESGITFLVVFGLTWWLACLDWLMPKGDLWVSTGFWVYALVGVLLGAVAAITIVLLLAADGSIEGSAGTSASGTVPAAVSSRPVREGVLEGTVPAEVSTHPVLEGTVLEGTVPADVTKDIFGEVAGEAVKPGRLVIAGGSKGVDAACQDLGKLLLALSCVWAYLWFSQLMLIWYANLPAETDYYIARINSDWKGLFYSNILVNWVIPALVLLRRKTRMYRVNLLYAAVVVVIGRWIDVLLMIFPDRFDFGPWYGANGLLVTLCWVLLFEMLRRRLGRQ